MINRLVSCSEFKHSFLFTAVERETRGPENVTQFTVIIVALVAVSAVALVLIISVVFLLRQYRINKNKKKKSTETDDTSQRLRMNITDDDAENPYDVVDDNMVV